MKDLLLFQSNSIGGFALISLDLSLCQFERSNNFRTMNLGYPLIAQFG